MLIAIDYSFATSAAPGIPIVTHPEFCRTAIIIESFLRAPPFFYYQDVNVLCVIKHPDNVINNTKTGV